MTTEMCRKVQLIMEISKLVQQTIEHICESQINTVVQDGSFDHDMEETQAFAVALSDMQSAFFRGDLGAMRAIYVKRMSSDWREMLVDACPMLAEYLTAV